MKHPLELDLNKADLILGLDEAGRGPLCGPVVVAGAIFPKGYQNDLIDDSKKLSEKKRRKAFKQIRKEALWYQIVAIPPTEIDRLNIYRAVQKAMEEIARKAPADFVLSDAMPLDLDLPVLSLVKGDRLSISIAAASILAKVSRDGYMVQMDREFPDYGLAKHKGYPTKAYKENLRQFGLHKEMRYSYKPVQALLNPS